MGLLVVRMAHNFVVIFDEYRTEEKERTCRTKIPLSHFPACVLHNRVLNKF